MEPTEFPEGFLDRLRERSPLRELIGRRVRLSRSGRQWKGCCPFHDEKTPSFYVYDQHFHCFGCGAHGDAISFVMQSQGLGFKEAVKQLAVIAGPPVPRPDLGVSQGAGRGAAPPPTTGPPQPEEHTMIKNESRFSDEQIEAVIATAAKLLVRQNQVTAASILANARGSLVVWDDSHDYYYIWRLTLSIPAAVYFDLEGREDREREIGAALGTAMQAVDESDSISVRIVAILDEDPDWRRKVNQHLSGKGITNQGRVRSENIATREHEGLLFRSLPEIHFYNALKRSGVPFAPLSVVLHGGLKYQRVEPDFIIYKEGIVMVVEIDGDLYHSETPAEAHARLKFLTDEGTRLERIRASECDTPEKAREAVDRVLATMGKHRRAR